jgi:hypothetical protein
MSKVAPVALTDEEIATLIEGIGVVVPAESENPEWLIPGFIHPGLTVLTGQPERGKTTLLLSMCKGILGGEWLEHASALRPAQRIFFGCEDRLGVHLVRRAFNSHPLVVPFQLTGWASPDRLADRLAAANCGMLILDSLTAAVKDINDQAEATNFIGSLRSLRMPVVVVHHSAVSGTGPSGAQAYKAAYRHTIQAATIEASADEMLLTLKLSGNDVLSSVQRVRIDRGSLEASRVEQPAELRTRMPARTKPQRLTAPEKAAMLGRLAKQADVDCSLGQNQIATVLLGGSRGSEQDANVRAVAGALGLGDKVGHRAVSDLIQSHRSDFDRAFLSEAA